MALWEGAIFAFLSALTQHFLLANGIIYNPRVITRHKNNYTDL